MTLTELRYITAIARHRHFGRAAAACFVSQPTLSVAVKKLEDELGVTIFERRKNDITITPVGDQIIEQAQRVIEEAERVKDIAASGRNQLETPFRLGAIYTVGPYLLPPLIPLVKKRAPAMQLILHEGFTSELAEALKNGDLDAIVIALPFEHPGIRVVPMYREPFVVALPIEHRWIDRKKIAAAELDGETVLLLSAGNCFRDQVLAACPALDRIDQGAIQKTLQGSSLETIRQMAASGAGITVLPSSSTARSVDLGGLLAIKPFAEPVPHRDIALAYRSSFPRDKAIDLLLTAIRDSDIKGVEML